MHLGAVPWKMTQHEESDSNRRDVLKGLGMGAIGIPMMTGTTAAEQGGPCQSNCGLRVRVEAGEGNPDTWVRRTRLTDEFRGRVEISGLSSGTSQVSTAIVPVGPLPNGEFKAMQTNQAEVNWSRGSLIDMDVFSIGGWQNGEYYLFAAVVEMGREAFGVAVSEPIEIRTN